MTSLYDLAVKVPTRVLQTELTILAEAETWAASKNLTPADLAGLRLYEDMYPLSMQIIVTALFARKAASLVAPHKDIEVGGYADEDLVGCRGLLEKTLKILGELTPEDVDGGEEKVVEFGVGKRAAKGEAREWYVLRYLIPTIYFHLTTLYDILRSKGMPLGKLTYLKHFLDGVDVSPPLEG